MSQPCYNPFTLDRFSVRMVHRSNMIPRGSLRREPNKMARDLTTPKTDRQNIFNNRYAIDKVRENLKLVVLGIE